MKNGEYIKEGKWVGSRWCEAEQQYHGHLYCCPQYPTEIQEEVTKDAEQFRKNLQDPEWIKKQDVGEDVIDIFKFFAGL